MIEKRRFHRVRFRVRSELVHSELTYRGEVENISLNGALVSLHEGIVVPQGDECLLTIYPEDGEIPLHFGVETVYVNFTMVGVRFVSFHRDAKTRLYRIMERVSPEPERLREELRILDGSDA